MSGYIIITGSGQGPVLQDMRPVARTPLDRVTQLIPPDVPGDGCRQSQVLTGFYPVLLDQGIGSRSTASFLYAVQFEHVPVDAHDHAGFRVEHLEDEA